LSISRLGAVARALTAGQILQLTGACGLALILLGTSYLAWSEHRSIAETNARSLRSTAYFLADHGDRLLEVASIALETTANAIADRGWDDIEHDDKLQRQLKSTASSMPHIADIWLNDASGRLRLTSLASPTPASNASDRLVFAEAKASHGELVAGERILGKVINRPTFLLARRLQDKNGHFNGMVSVTADLNYFSDYWSKVKLPAGTVVSLMRTGSPEVLVQFPEPPAGKQPKVPRIWEQYSTGPSASGGAVFETGTAILRRVAGLPLFIAIEAPPDTVLLAWYGWLSMTLPFAGFAMLCLSALMIAGLMQNRRETATRRELEQAQKRLIEVNAGLENAIAQRTIELTETNEEVQRFAYIVSHDLRAPLINIMGFTSELATLRDELAARLHPKRAGRTAGRGAEASVELDETDAKGGQVLLEDFDEALGFIKSSIDKMDRLINAILTLSRQGARRFQIEPVDMNALLHAIADATAHQLLDADTDMVIEDLPPLESDRLALEQIFSNLIDNAVKYLREGVPGRIRVSARRAGSFIVYLVEDNGRGISPDDFKRIFELFRRSGVQDRQGEGIGLANVKALVRRLGGIVTVESELGAGTVFKVTLPMRSRA
jgi:signal transduction histidine kinase